MSAIQILIAFFGITPINGYWVGPGPSFYIRQDRTVVQAKINNINRALAFNTEVSQQDRLFVVKGAGLGFNFAHEDKNCLVRVLRLRLEARLLTNNQIRIFSAQISGEGECDKKRADVKLVIPQGIWKRTGSQ